MGTIFIIGFFYTYTGALGFESVVVDILSFVLAMVLGYGLSGAIIESGYKPRAPLGFWAAALIIIFLFFQQMVWFPPHIPLFQDVPTGTYGLNH